MQWEYRKKLLLIFKRMRIKTFGARSIKWQAGIQLASYYLLSSGISGAREKGVHLFHLDNLFLYNNVR